MVWTDTGNCFSDPNGQTIANSMCLNEGGEWNTFSAAGSTQSILNSTAFNCNIAQITGSNSSATALTAFRNMLLDYPSISGQGNFEEAGAGFSSAPFVRQSSLSMDYNYYYMMKGSGDTQKVGPASLSADTCTGNTYCLLPNNGITGAPVSYLSAPNAATPLQTAQSATISSLIVTCASCTFTTAPMIAGDYICDTTMQPILCAPIATVTSATSVTLQSPGITWGGSNTIVGYAGYKSTASQFYGQTAGYGTHDIHANPQFVDASRTICVWYNAVSGAPATECVGSQTGNIPVTTGFIFSTTSTPNTTHIVCSACNFTGWGNIGTNTVVEVYTGASGSTVRGTSLISAVVDATHITLATAITGLTAGDAFTFITVTQGVGRGIVSINGWDYGSGASNGAGTPVATTASSWATTANALSYIRAGFTPMSGQLKNAAQPSDCTTGKASTCDIGAVPVYPATTQAIM